jgi:hypothetical protein
LLYFLSSLTLQYDKQKVREGKVWNPKWNNWSILRAVVWKELCIKITYIFRKITQERRTRKIRRSVEKRTININI